MIGNLLCRLGWHDWKLSQGAGYTLTVILFNKDCRRCGKHQTGSMVI